MVGIIDTEVEKKLTDVEKDDIQKILDKAKGRRRVKTYTTRFIVDYMLETYKDFTYDNKKDAVDMLNAILKVAEKCKIMSKKKIEEEREYYKKEYISVWFDN